jgi:excisionase family DNA binding protein
MAVNGDEWMSTAEAAQHLGLSIRKLYAAIDDCQIPAYKFGRVIRLRADDVLRKDPM